MRYYFFKFNFIIIRDNPLHVAPILSGMFGFKKLDFFLETLYDGIGSHRIIKAIFLNNEYLMKKCPREKIIESVTKITKHGLKHQYLALLSSITYCGEKNIVDNQFDVVKSLTHPSVIQKVVKFLCPVNDEEYKLKQEMMVS
jgi:hypothetical protein